MQQSYSVAAATAGEGLYGHFCKRTRPAWLGGYLPPEGECRGQEPPGRSLKCADLSLIL